MTVLSHQTIVHRCALPNPLISKNYDVKQVRSAAYDLRVGDEYLLSGPTPQRSVKISRLRQDEKTIAIHSNQVLLVRTFEDVRLPKDVVGHLSLKLDVMLQGLIMSNQSQVDAGYIGPIYALLYNLSNTSVYLQLEQPIIRLEFEKLDYPTDRPYAGDYKPNFTLADAVPAPIDSSLEVIRNEVDSMSARIQRRTLLAVLAVVVTGLAAVPTVLMPIVDKTSQAHVDAERSADAAEGKDARLTRADTRISELSVQLDAVERELATLRSQLVSPVATPTTQRRG